MSPIKPIALALALAASTAVAAQAQTAAQLNATVACLEIEVQTGNDDFRADSVLAIDVDLRRPGAVRSTRTPMRAVWNSGMGDRTFVRVDDFCFAPDERVALRQLDTVRMVFGSGTITQGILMDLGNISADNWNLDRVVMRATFVDTSIPEVEILDRSGRPLNRFGRNEQQILPLQLESFNPI